jgi:hypothetical protein
VIRSDVAMFMAGEQHVHVGGGFLYERVCVNNSKCLAMSNDNNTKCSSLGRVWSSAMHAHPQDACSGRMAVHLTRLGRGWHVMGLCAMTKRWSAHTLSFELADVLMCWCAQLYPEVACTSSMARNGWRASLLRMQHGSFSTQYTGQSRAGRKSGGTKPHTSW